MRNPKITINNVLGKWIKIVEPFGIRGVGLGFGWDVLGGVGLGFGWDAIGGVGLGFGCNVGVLGLGFG